MIKSTILAVTAVMFLAFTPTIARAQSAAPDALQTHAEVIRDRFLAAVRACGPEPDFIPAVVVRTSPALAHYVSADRRKAGHRANISTPTTAPWSPIPKPMAGFRAS